MRKKRRILLWIIFVIVVALPVLFLVVTSLPPFGGDIEGDRLARIEQNPHYRDGAFVNVQPQAPFKYRDAGSFLVDSVFYNEVRVPPAPIPVVPVPPESLKEARDDELRAFWIGHSSAYIEIDGIRLLIDPIFSDYASPFDFGPKRFHPPPIELENLPFIHAVLISHDHYDHLDMKTVKALSARGSGFYVPIGIGAHLERWGVPGEQIHEFEWWQEATLDGIRVVSTPARHYSGRRLTDYKASLWSSWAVAGPKHRIFYSGDTGYSPHFREIGERLGPFDMNFLKIGAYGPGQAWLDIHMSPEQAVRAHTDLKGSRLFPLHWATFNLAYHDWDEPIRRTLAAARKIGFEVVTPRVGEIVTDGRPFHSEAWWKL